MTSKQSEQDRDSGRRDDRADRLAEALRANLRRRKDQARARGETAATRRGDGRENEENE